MARIRTVKPEFWTDSKIVGLSPLARLLFIGIWNFADDFGAIEADSLQLKLKVLPAEQCDADELVDELLTAGLLCEMTNGTTAFWVVAGWERHQKVDKRSNSQFGDPGSWNPAVPSTSPAELRRIPPRPRDGREGNGGDQGKEETPSSSRHDNEDGESDADDPSDDAASTFEQHFWPAYPATNGRKPEKGKALTQWRKLTLEQQRRALIGARNLATSDTIPKHAHRFLRKASGEFPFDDWQQASKPSSNGQARAAPRTGERVPPVFGSEAFERRRLESQRRAEALTGGER